MRDRTDAWAAEVREAVDALIRCFDEHIPLLTSRADARLLARQVAAAGLVRCRSLLGAMRLLEADHPDVNGLLLRNLWEISTISLYVLLGGAGALNEVAGDHVRQIETLVDRNDLDELKSLVASWEVPTARMRVEDIAKKVGPLLRRAGDEEADATVGYNLLYRSESTFGGHGLGAVTPYVDLTVEPWQLRTSPGPITVEQPVAHPGLGGLWAGILAHHVFKVFGVGTTALDKHSTALLKVMRGPES